MPFDITSHVNALTNSLANKSSIGVIFLNPLWISILLVIVIYIIIHYTGWTDTPTFRLLFYLFGICVVVFTIHDSLLKENLRETLENSSVSHIVASANLKDTDLPTGGAVIQPRSAEKAVESFNRTVESVPVRDIDDLMRIV